MMVPRPRAFVSSVMENYAVFRDATAEGIRHAGCDPICAEDFPAADASPRTACLDGVRSADALVLLLGARYGFVGSSGLSATEEEYEEARSARKRVLVFLEKVNVREPRQEALISKVQDYVTGHWRKTFCGPDELASLVQEAVAAADFQSTSGHEARTRGRIEAALARRPAESQGIVWLHAAWTTPRDEEVIDPLDLGDGSFQRQVQRLAHECEPPLFAYEEPKQVVAAISLLRIKQGDPDNWRDARSLAVLEMHVDGTLSVAQNVTSTEARADVMDGTFDMYFIDPSVVRTRLERAWSFAAAWWKDHDPYLRHDPLLYTVALHDVGARTFAPAPRETGGGISIPPECPESPLVAYDGPRTVSRTECADPNAEIDRAIKLLERRFQEWENRW